MSLILCIETGTDICSVGLARNGELVSLRESDEGRDHAKKVAVFVDELLRETDVAPDELDAVAVGMGPGSYTGLRIGVSFAKGMCYALGIPLVAVGSLDALAEVAVEDHEAGIIDVENWSQARLCPMVDARRMEVYTRIDDSAGHPLNEVSAEIITVDSFAELRRTAPLVIFGNGAAKCREVLPDAEYVDVVPSARGLARLAQQRLGACRQTLEAAEQQREQQARTLAEMASREQVFQRWQALDALIGAAEGKTYRKFVQGLTFERLLAHANRRLRELSDRYVLLADQTRHLEFQVMDNYQAGECRSARNLSGGESFLVSLALALGLSRMTGHSIKIESLFLDEGFGTLDEDALDAALSVLSQLRQEGTLIGIISHVPALRERISAQIAVIPEAGGLSRLEGAGCSRVE